jgi:hypothetical protein
MNNSNQDRTIQDDDNQTTGTNADQPAVGQTPLDPTDNAAGMMNDTTGMTGISKDTNNPNTPPNTSGPVSRTMSDYKSQISADPLPEDPVDAGTTDESQAVAPPGSTPTGNKVFESQDNTESQGEQSVSGTTPDPASDDDTLENAHNVGLRLDEDEEHPKPLGVGDDMDKAEEYQRSH